MSSFSASSSPSEIEPGQLLNELEQRQDDVLQQLDDLDAKLNEVLKGLGATMGDGTMGDGTMDDGEQETDAGEVDSGDAGLPLAA